MYDKNLSRFSTRLKGSFLLILIYIAGTIDTLYIAGTKYGMLVCTVTPLPGEQAYCSLTFQTMTSSHVSHQFCILET